jgi:putative nucleotidyltransferase with HDIG domain
MLPQKVDLILSSVETLRPMPSSVTRILKAVEDPNINSGYLAELIGLDQALTALILQMSNSAAAGYGRTCTSITEAVLRLGFKRIKSLAMGAGASGSLSRRLNGYRLGSGELCNHSVTTAVASEWLARTVRYRSTEEAYVAGLLHDMGKLLLDQYVLEDYSKMVDLMHRYHLQLWQVEEQLLGIDHAAVGSLMAEKWQFPLILVDAIHFHHAPSLAHSEPTLAAIINIANAFASKQSATQSDMFSKEIHPESLTILHIDDKTLARYEDNLSKFLSAGSN